MYLLKLPNVFVQIAKYICPNCRMYLSNGRIQGRKQLTHFLAIKQSFYSLLLNCCRKSQTARGRLQSSVLFSAACRLIIVGHCAWSRWSNWTDVLSPFCPEDFGHCFTFLVAISLTDSTKKPAGGGLWDGWDRSGTTTGACTTDTRPPGAECK